MSLESILLAVSLLVLLVTFLDALWKGDHEQKNKFRRTAVVASVLLVLNVSTEIGKRVSERKREHAASQASADESRNFQRLSSNFQSVREEIARVLNKLSERTSQITPSDAQSLAADAQRLQERLNSLEDKQNDQDPRAILESLTKLKAEVQRLNASIETDRLQHAGNPPDALLTSAEQYKRPVAPSNSLTNSLIDGVTSSETNLSRVEQDPKKREGSSSLSNSYPPPAPPAVSTESYLTASIAARDSSQPYSGTCADSARTLVTDIPVKAKVEFTVGDPSASSLAKILLRFSSPEMFSAVFREIPLGIANNNEAGTPVRTVWVNGFTIEVKRCLKISPKNVACDFIVTKILGYDRPLSLCIGDGSTYFVDSGGMQIFAAGSELGPSRAGISKGN